MALLVVLAGVPGSELLLATIGVVVIASVLVHGATATPFSAWYGRRASETTLAEERESTAAGLFTQVVGEVPRITVEELSGLLSGPAPPIVLDVRSRSSYDRDGSQIPGSIRVLPDQVVEWATDRSLDDMVVTYCT